MRVKQKYSVKAEVIAMTMAAMTISFCFLLKLKYYYSKNSPKWCLEALRKTLLRCHLLVVSVVKINRQQTVNKDILVKR